MISITFFSLKGGTGKTSLCAAIGFLLAQEGRSVLLIDLDPQGHLSRSFDLPPLGEGTSLFDVLIHGRPLAEAIRPTPYPRLSLVPASEEHLELNTALIHQPWREWRLKDALSAMPSPAFEWVMMDVGANLNLMTYNALFAGRILIVPTLPDVYSYLSLQTLFAFLEKTGRDYRFRFDMIWILLNRLNNHRPLDRQTRDALKKYYHQFLFPVMVREDPKVSETMQSRLPLPAFAPQTTAVRDLIKVVRLFKTLYSRQAG